jgi:hypothetical protein
MLSAPGRRLCGRSMARPDAFVCPSVSSRNRVVADDQTLDLAVLVLGDEEQVNQRTDVGGVFPTRRLGCV